MEKIEKYEKSKDESRTSVSIRWSDVEALTKFAHEADVSMNQALDEALEAGVKVLWRALIDKRYAEEWEEYGHA